MPSPANARPPGKRTPDRHLWPVIALASLLLLAMVVAGQYSRTTARANAERLRLVLHEAEGRQQALLARLRDAEAALAAAPHLRAAPTAAGGNDPAQRLHRAAADLERLAAAIDANTGQAAPPGPAPGLQQALDALARDAMHLPTMRHRPPPGVPAAPVLLRGSDLRALLHRARDAAALGDLALVQHLLTDARRLLGWYRQEPRALALAARLEQLRDRLDADPDPGARLRRLAADLRAVATQWPVANPAPTTGVATGPSPGAGTAPVPLPAARVQR